MELGEAMDAIKVATAVAIMHAVAMIGVAYVSWSLGLIP